MDGENLSKTFENNIEALCLHLVCEKRRKLNHSEQEDDIIDSTYMRGAVIPTSVRKGISYHLHIRTWHTVPRFFVKQNAALGTDNPTAA